MHSSAPEKSKVCRWFSAIAAAAALGFAPVAAAGNPVPALYNEFATNGALSCHSKADLRAVLVDATLQQYGDPFTMIGLKLAARKQLVVGCRHGTQSSTPGSTAPRADPQRRSSPPATSQTHAKKNGKKSRNKRPRVSAAPPPTEASTLDGPTDRRMLLGTGLLLLTLATGGWAARRAFNGKP